MLSKESRKEAVRSFKDLKPSIGIYSVRSAISGRTWVGASRNLEAMKNSCWFQLRNGLHREKSLQEEWDLRGESAFEYEIVDRLDVDMHDLEIGDELKKRRSEWAARLNAPQLL